MANESRDEVTRKIGAPSDPPSSVPSENLPYGVAFAEGDLVADRYRVVRFIAGGGIGEVYEVEDQELGGRLALKTLQAMAARSEEARERFRREIQLARRVTHRNVCRIFEAGVHGSTPREQRLFLTMELLRGETLEARLERTGPMAPEEVLPLLRQMVAGLEAAHACGVVHRDFKASNVMLEPRSGDGSGGDRVVITDFGLAKVLEEEDDVFRTSDESGVSGTVAYMAPEQLSSDSLTPRSDIYALGVVLFQMVTGRLPFDTRSSLSALVQLLQEDAPSPRSLVPELDRRWDLVILRCLEKRPEDRFASVLEVEEALEGDRRLRLPSHVRRRRLWTAATVALGLLLAGAGLWWSGRIGAPARIEAGDLKQLTADPGLEMEPDFAPDGRRLAYASDRRGSFEIYLRDLESGEETSLTADGLRNVQPAWAPDGSRIAYVSQDRGGIWTLDPEARDHKPRPLTSFGSRPAWSPDGRWIAFQEDSRREVSARALPANPPSTLWQVPAEGGEPLRLTRAGEPLGGHGEPAWSPDGRWIAFSSGNRTEAQLWAVEPATGRLRSLVSEAWVSVHPVYGDDGRNLFYIGISRDGSYNASFAVWRLPLEPRTGEPAGASEKVTLLGLASIRQMALAPKSDRLVYSALATASGLHQLPLDAAGRPVGPESPWSREGQRNSRPYFSFDGRYLAFDRWQIGSNLDIWVRDLGSGEPERRLTDYSGWDSQATWLADGTLTYFSTRGGPRAIWSLDLATGKHAKVQEMEEGSDWARVSPDGRTVAYHSSTDSVTTDVWCLDLESGETRRLTRDPELAGFPVWSPDGRRLALEIKRGEDTHVAVLSPFETGEDGTVPVRRLTFDPGDSWPYSWAPDNDRIAFAGRRGEQWNLYWVSASTGEVVQITDETDRDGYLRYPAWSPAGNAVVYERARTVGDLWQVELSTGRGPSR